MQSFIYFYSLALASLVLLLSAFFPIQKSEATDPIQPPTFLHDIELNVSQLYKQEVDRVIVVIIDALRTDFVTEENMPFSVSTFRKQGCILSVQVESPTVTLPRIKALTTGSIPQFVDVILNLASTEAITDSILHRAVEQGKKIIFYGDNTWLTLYPNMFERYEGVSSFYVNDFHEVDDNVTRNVVTELNKTDWDIMFLHYLGLDHIGHVFGPYSHLIQPKLQEMDNVIEKIYVASKSWDRKIIMMVTGDHGMRNSGGHGGASTEETHVPLISIGIPCKTDSETQTNIASTIAILMGLTLPANNIGHVILNMCLTFPVNRLLYIFHYNALLLHAKTKEHADIFEEASSYHYKYLKTNNESDAAVAQKLYLNYCKKTSANLIRSSVKQDVDSLLIANAFLVNCFCAIVHSIVEPHSKWSSKRMALLFTALFMLQFILPNSSLLVVAYLFIIANFVLYYLIRIFKTVRRCKPNCDIKTFLIFCTILHKLSLLSSSFIEEEHQVWYYFWGTFIIVCCLTLQKPGAAIQLFLLFLTFRFLRTINQTGDKWAHLPDLAQWVLLEDNYIYLQAIFCAGLILLYICCSLCKMQRNFLLLNAVIVILIYIFHIQGKQSSFLGQLLWFLIFISLSSGLLQSSQYVEQIIITWMLICALLMRSYNVILLSACIHASVVSRKVISRVDILTVIHIWLGKTFLFMQGHSNSLASVDVVSGYVGIQEYIPTIVILQVVCHSYAFPILTNLLMLKYYFSYADKIWCINIVSQLLVLVTTCILIVIQRHHLFVWTVFAPKLLIESCHSFILFVQIILFYCIVYMKSAFVRYFKNRIKDST